MMPDFEWMETVAYREGYRAGKEDALKDMIPKDYHDRVCEEMAKRHQAEIENMVEVVRCKECKWASHWQTLGICSVTSQRVKADDFCSYGERKTDKPTHGYMWTCPNCGLEVHSDFTKCPCCGYERQTERSGE